MGIRIDGRTGTGERELEDGREIAVVSKSEDPFGGEETATRAGTSARKLFFFSLYLILFYLAPVFVQVRPIVPFGWFHAPVNTRRGRRFVKFLRSLIAWLLAMQRERRAYYQLG